LPPTLTRSPVSTATTPATELAANRGSRAISVWAYVIDTELLLEPLGSVSVMAALDAFEGLKPGDQPTAPLLGPIVWNYPGRTQADAAQRFAEPAQQLAVDGYEPVSQSWAEGRPGVGRFLMPGIASNTFKPNGFLTVTYRRIRTEASPAPAAPGPDVMDQIKKLGELRDLGLVTDVEFEDKKKELLSRL
jgi:hypothetical protein